MFILTFHNKALSGLLPILGKSVGLYTQNKSKTVSTRKTSGATKPAKLKKMSKASKAGLGSSIHTAHASTQEECVYDHFYRSKHSNSSEWHSPILHKTVSLQVSSDN